MRRTLSAFAICGSLAGTCASGAEIFSGETAAILDWSVKNCEFKSTDKTRKLVEDEKAKSEAKFSNSYMKGFSSKLLSEPGEDRQRIEKLCNQIKEWYGQSGTRMVGLIAGSTQPVEPTTSSKTGAVKGERSRRKRDKQP